jgi:hypothetical protein
VTSSHLKKLTAIAGLGVALAAPVAAVQAQEVWRFQDDDIEFILNADLTLKSSGALAVGDIFVSVFEIPTFTINGVNAIPPGQELTGVAAVQLAAINCPATGLPGPCPGGGVGTQFIFEPVDSGLNSILALGFDPDAVVPEGGAGEGATISMFFNAALPVPVGTDRDLILDFAELPATNCTSLEDCIDQASLGILLQVDGFESETNFWIAAQVAPGGGDIETVAAAGESTLIAGFNFNQDNIFNLVGTAGPLIGSGTIAGGAGLENDAIARSDFDARKLVTEAPEPGGLALLAAGLLAFGFRVRMRKS